MELDKPRFAMASSDNGGIARPAKLIRRSDHKIMKGAKHDHIHLFCPALPPSRFRCQMPCESDDATYYDPRFNESIIHPRLDDGGKQIIVSSISRGKELIVHAFIVCLAYLC